YQFYFFFQAEDGIRDGHVTGVQTCALPIYRRRSSSVSLAEHVMEDKDTEEDLRLLFAPGSSLGGARPKASVIEKYGHLTIAKFRSEERRVGKECRARRAPDELKEKRNRNVL